MLSNLFVRSRTAPTGYEKVRLLFHAIRTVQLVSSIVVGSIVCAFLYWLVHDKYSVPWTLTILTVTSFLTVICLTATLAFHCLTGLSPKVNLVLNSVMFACWALGWSMLFRWAYHTITRSCSVEMWEIHGENGHMVCRAYKTMFAFTVTGLLSTAGALALDVHIHKLATRFGKHMLLDNNNAVNKARVVDARANGDIEGRHSDAFEIPHAGYGAKFDPAMSQQSKNLLNGEGYAVKDSHFDYDTGYRGGHAERVFGAEK